MKEQSQHCKSKHKLAANKHSDKKAITNAGRLQVEVLNIAKNLLNYTLA